jgi:N-formylglutamate amidohydrolase
MNNLNLTKFFCPVKLICMSIWRTQDRASREKENRAISLFDPPVLVTGPAIAQSPLVFSFPHSGRVYPPEFLAQSALELRDLRSSEDAYVDELFTCAALPDAVFVQALFPRAWVDANRHRNALDPQMFLGKFAGLPLEQRPQVEAGLGVIPKVVADQKLIYRNRLPMAEIHSRLENTYLPYHAEVRAALDRAQQKFGFALLIDCHSMPSICAFAAGGKKLDVVLGDRHGTSCAPELVLGLAQAIRTRGFELAHNYPYAGGHSVERYGAPEYGVHAVQIELSRALYLQEDTICKQDGFAHQQEKIAGLMSDIGRLAEAFAENSPKTGSKTVPF